LPTDEKKPTRLLPELGRCGISYVVVTSVLNSLYSEEAMPDITVAQLLPTAPLHWTSILHYLVLALAIFTLVTSGDKASILYILILATLALLAGADLYINRFPMPHVFIFIMRVLILGIPLILAGISPTEQTRSLSVVTALLAFPILVMTFFSCWIPFLGDPRIMSWCK
jgi:hypothetical protein